MQDISIKKALVSVSNKTGIVEFAKILADSSVEILSTGGTARLLKENDIPVTPVGSYTGSPEIMDGRVKTLHPKIHGGILAIRDNESHVSQMQEHGIDSIDLVVVNLYPFKETIAKPDVTLQDAIENIDIGGPTMIRSAAKNHTFVGIVVDPEDYAPVGQEIKEKGSLSVERRQNLMVKAFSHTAEYDKAITTYFSSTYSN